MKELTWSNIEEMYHKVDYHAYEQLCLNSKASDFYFDTRISQDLGLEDEIMISITPKEYFDQVGVSWDQSMNLDHILNPDLFEELMEATYTTNLSFEKTNQTLLELGFLKSDKFSQLFDDLEESFEEDCLDEDCDL